MFDIVVVSMAALIMIIIIQIIRLFIDSLKRIFPSYTKRAMAIDNMRHYEHQEYSRGMGRIHYMHISRKYLK